MIGLVYRGYNISPVGSVLGLVWGFFDALVGGAILAWLYNLLRGHSPKPLEEPT
jgi:CDP-diglyceride synthetase